MKGISALLLFSFALTLAGCEKEIIRSADCDRLRKGLLATDINQVSKALEHLSLTYSEANLQKLAESISDRCAISVTVLCFECIKTNPPQTEVSFSFSESGTSVERIIDFSYTPDYKIRVVRVHY